MYFFLVKKDTKQYFFYVKQTQLNIQVKVNKKREYFSRYLVIITYYMTKNLYDKLYDKTNER